MAEFVHTPVMLDETLESLRVTPGGRYCDATLGGGGHAQALLERSAPDGQLVGLDRDPAALTHCREKLARFGERVILRQGNFADLVPILRELEMAPVDGVLVDLGVSSHQLDTPGRGFSLAAAGPLDMRMDPQSGSTAAELIEELSERELAQLIRRYGEEPKSSRIARRIKQAQLRGELATTLDLQRVVVAAVGGRGPRSGKIHPATRTFMALRMAVNDELGALSRFLDSVTEILRPGGRVAVIAFHSLEDRAVKQGLARLAHPCTCPPDLPFCCCGLLPQVSLITRQPLRPSDAELARNPRSRSARLRAAERC